MNQNHVQNYLFHMENEKGDSIVKGEISGESDVPFLDDLKLKAVIALLNSIDRQNFNDVGRNEFFEDHITEIEETINEMKKHRQFQGSHILRN